jgi:hypothetical protein
MADPVRFQRDFLSALRQLEKRNEGRQFVLLSIMHDTAPNVYVTITDQTKWGRRFVRQTAGTTGVIEPIALQEALYNAPLSCLQTLFLYRHQLNLLGRSSYFRRAPMTVVKREPSSLFRQIGRLLFGPPTNEVVYFQLVVSPLDRAYRRHVAHSELDLLGIPLSALSKAAAAGDVAADEARSGHKDNGDEAIESAAERASIAHLAKSAPDPLGTLKRVEHKLRFYRTLHAELSEQQESTRRQQRRKQREAKEEKKEVPVVVDDEEDEFEPVSSSGEEEATKEIKEPKTI